MFQIADDSVKFLFSAAIGEKNNKGFYEWAGDGEVPVPVLSASDRILLPIGEGNRNTRGR